MRQQNHFFWQKTPFFKLLIPLIIGICIGTNLNHFHDSLYMVGFGSMITILILHIYVKSIHPIIITLQSLLVLLLTILIGIFLSFQKNITHQKNWYGSFTENNTAWVAQIIQAPIEKPKSYQILVQIIQQKSNLTPTTLAGKAIIYLQKTPAADSLKTGTVIGFTKNLQPIKNSGNPFTFDYKTYQLHKGVTHQIYLQQNEWTAIGKVPLPKISTFIEKAKVNIQHILKSNFKDTTSYALSMSLLLGDKTDLDNNIYQSFTNTGIVHVIAVSGMHLALIFVLFAFILKPMKIKSKWLYFFSALIIIWGFCLLAGSAASIVRAATMTSFYILSDTLERQKNKYNPIFASAFVLLCYNPLWLWDVGFQLSFAAVLSILIFYPSINNLWNPRNYFIKLIWQMLAVTLAAQILTTPISIYYFKQFPVYFLFANLIAIPLTNFLLILIILLLIFYSFLPIIATVFAFLIDLGFRWLVQLIHQIEKLPSAIISSIHINTIQLFCLYLMIGAMAYAIFQHSKKYYYISLISLLAFVMIRANDYYQKQNQQLLIVYNIPQKTKIHFINHRLYQSLGDSLNFKETQFHTQPTNILLRIKDSDATLIQKKFNFINFLSKRLALIQETHPFYTDSITPIDIDIAILTGNKKLYINQLLKTIRPKLIIADGSTPLWRKNYWKKDCDSLSIPFYDTEIMGAFVMPIR